MSAEIYPQMLCNVGSILFGLLAWILPLVALWGRGKKPMIRALLTHSSVAACALALFLQILNSKRLVDLGEWSSLMDTQGAVAFVSGVLLAVTAVLNAVVWLVRIKEEQ